VNSHFTQNRVEFLQLDALWGVLTVLGSDVARGARHTRVLVLGALHDNLHPVSFLGHRDGRGVNFCF
jgi:hypothetical protein